MIAAPKTLEKQEYLKYLEQLDNDLEAVEESNQYEQPEPFELTVQLGQAVKEQLAQPIQSEQPAQQPVVPAQQPVVPAQQPAEPAQQPAEPGQQPAEPAEPAEPVESQQPIQAEQPNSLSFNIKEILARPSGLLGIASFIGAVAICKMASVTLLPAAAITVGSAILAGLGVEVVQIVSGLVSKINKLIDNVNGIVEKIGKKVDDNVTDEEIKILREKVITIVANTKELTEKLEVQNVNTILENCAQATSDPILFLRHGRQTPVPQVQVPQASASQAPSLLR